jgi:two-component system, OmpR family, alkaline phosphatase synthesis response regulator PhoP
VNAAARVLLIEDDPDIARWVALELTEAGYDAVVRSDGVTGLIAARETPPDLLILDLGLPDFAGIEIARRLRGAPYPIVVLTARDDVAEKVALFEAGADDYVVKPFHAAELLARIAAHLRRRAGGVSQAGDLRIDALRRHASWAGRDLRLSPREFDLLATLALQPGRVLARDELAQRVWEGDAAPASNVVEVHVANLRTKLRQVGAFGLIRTVRGVGYALRI